MGLTLLANASVPPQFWHDAFETAVFIINRLPTDVLHGVSPIYKLLGISPGYYALRVFGSACFPLLRPYNTHKMSYRSTECVFIGYSLNHKGYKCLDPQTHRLYISCHVLFNESSFPFSKITNNSAGSAPQTLPDILAQPPLISPFTSSAPQDLNQTTVHAALPTSEHLDQNCSQSTDTANTTGYHFPLSTTLPPSSPEFSSPGETSTSIQETLLLI